jgi:hypothetical protein
VHKSFEWNVDEIAPRAFNKKNFLNNLWKRIRRIDNNTVQDISANNKPEDTKNVILGVSGALILVLLVILIYIPASVSRYIAHIDPDSINYGSGRLWNYASRFSIPILHYCIFPIIILGTNSKMRKTLKREIKDFLDDL